MNSCVLRINVASIQCENCCHFVSLVVNCSNFIFVYYFSCFFVVCCRLTGPFYSSYCTKTFTGHREWVRTVSVSPDGTSYSLYHAFVSFWFAKQNVRDSVVDKPFLHYCLQPRCILSIALPSLSFAVDEHFLANWKPLWSFYPRKYTSVFRPFDDTCYYQRDLHDQYLSLPCL